MSSHTTLTASKTGQVVRGDRLHRMLIGELSRAGCFRPARARSVAYGLFILTGYGGGYVTLLTGPGWGFRTVAIATLAFISVQAGFLAHEATHGSLTRNRNLAGGIGQVFDTFLTGLCYSYFCHIHRLHHPYCNDRLRDPDIQSGVFSFYRQSAESKSGVGGLISRHQAVLIWILVWLQGFSLKMDSLNFLKRNQGATRADQAAVLLHLALWFGPPALMLGIPAALLNYLLMTLLIGPYLGTIFIVNHIGTRVIEPDESLSVFMKEITTTRNLGSTRAHDIFFGGLNNHIEHHLFPLMPTARLRAARALTREFCRRHGIVYREMSWFAAASEVFRYLKTMSVHVPRSVPQQRSQQ